MRNFVVLIFVLILANFAFSQTQIIESSQYYELVGTTASGPYSGSYIGGNGQGFSYYTLCIINLQLMFGGLVTSLNSGSVQLSIGNLYGDHWGVGSYTNDITNQSPSYIVNSIQSISTPSLGSNITLSASQLNIINQRELIIGVLSNQSFRNYIVSCSGSLTATVIQQVTLNVTYNQGSGNIVAYVGAYNTPPAPAQVTASVNSQITIAPLSPTISNYQLVYNYNIAPRNQSF